MKKNKIKNNKKNFAWLSLATILPIATTGVVTSALAPMTASAASTSVSYQKGYVQEVSLSNSNFNSSSSTTLNSSPSGWSKKISDKNTTAGVINVGSSFQRYMTSTYYLSKNPGKSASDSHILMINSKTKTSGDSSAAKQGFRSNSVTLAANSYYSFKVAFKSDTNFESYTSYEQAGQVLDANKEISKETFRAKPFKVNEDGVVEEEYISFSYHNGSYYLLKTLDTENPTTITEALADTTIFYKDDNFVGFLYGEENKPVYVNKSDFELKEDKDNVVDIKAGATAYECPNITFVPTGESKEYGVFKIKEETPYYNSRTAQNPLNADARGSIYLDGLKDNDGKTVKAEFLRLNSKQWVTFNFFIATGAQSQTVNLELWLGSKNTTSSGAAFFDNVRINQYSENNFWKAYQENCDLGYDLVYTEGENEHQDCTQLFDFRVSKKLSAKELSVSDKEEEIPTYNFDFEEGVYNDDPTTLKGWEKAEGSKGKARVFDMTTPQDFKSNTGYDFVGTDLSYDVSLEETDEGTPSLKVNVKEEKDNKFALGLWTEDNDVKVSSQAIKIESQKVYKITAKYKVAQISEGSAYVLVKENDKLVKKYVDDGLYTLASEASSSAISSNSTNNFTNNYSTLEFFVKGGTLYDSSVNISLALGTSDTPATGCIVFDNIAIERTTLDEFNNASNKLQLGGTAATTTVPNGEFDNVTTSGTETGLFAPQNWTITKGKGVVFGGVINTAPEKYQKYYQQYETAQGDEQNKYYWASYANPGKTGIYDLEENNVLALGNVSKSWQNLKSETLDISANSAYNSSSSPAYKLSFKYKTNSAGQGFKVSIFEESGMKLYESAELTSSAWKQHSVYLKSFPGASKIYVEIDFGTQEMGTTGVVYLDKFALDELGDGQSVPSNEDVVDMDKFGLNLPTNSITSNLDTTHTPAFTGTVTSNLDETHAKGGIVKGSRFEKDSSNFYVEGAQNENFFFITIGGAGAYSIQSNFNIDLEASTYYVLSFKMKSYFNYLNDGITLDEKKSYDYGLTFGLTGYDYIKNVVSNKEFKEYKLFINSSEAKTAKLYMSLICDTPETAGSVAIYDINLAKSTEDEFKEAQKTTTAKGYDVNEVNVFAAEAQASTDETETPADDGETEGSNDQGFNWLLIPTLITALAIVIAVIGYFLRKVKIKKIEIKRKNSYDRKKSANVDFIKRKAAEERDNELKTVESSKAKFEEELERLETAHKSKIVSLRENDKGEMSKETDKEFKTFAKKRTVLAEKISVLDKQIEEIKSAEHLLSLERKIFADQEAQRRKLEKASRKAEKETLKKEETKTKGSTKDKK